MERGAVSNVTGQGRMPIPELEILTTTRESARPARDPAAATAAEGKGRSK